MSDFLPIDLNNHLTTAGDISLVLCGLLVVVTIVLWNRSHAVREGTVLVVAAVGGLLSMFAVRGFAVATGRMLAPDGMHNHPVWFEYRWALILGLAIGGLFFTRRLFVALNSRFAILRHWSLYVGIAAIAFVLAFL